MNTRNSFNLKRFGLILRTETIPAYKAALITFAAVGGLMFIINIASVSSWDKWNMHLVFYPLVLFLTGLLTTSYTFRDMHSKSLGYAYLTLPGSRLEKYAAKFLLTSVGMIVGTMVLYFIVSLVSAGVTKLAFGVNHGLFNPFEPLIWKLIPHYVIAHSLFFLGAVVFKKLSFLKTVLALTVFGIGLNVLIVVVYGLMALFMYLGFRKGSGTAWSFGWIADWSITGTLENVKRFEVLYRVLVIFYYFILPPYLWVTGYFRFAEKEARG